jgi:hypothetical protein
MADENSSNRDDESGPALKDITGDFALKSQGDMIKIRCNA